MKKLKQIWASKKVRFAVVTAIYILWFVIWTQNLLWLLGVVLIYDYYFSRYIDKIYLNKYRAFKAKHKTAKTILEWVEALLYAVVVVVPLKLYFFGMYVIPTPSMERTLLVGDYILVNRLEYGPKMPNTPISFPFVQHTMPFTTDTPSFVDWFSFDYKRLGGYSNVEKMDVVVFNFPAGDTVALKWQDRTYYDLVRTQDGRNMVYEQSKVVYRPVDKRENYVKRCVAVAGDTLQFTGNTIYINSTAVGEPSGIEYEYVIKQSGVEPYVAPLTAAEVQKMISIGANVSQAVYEIDSVSFFPHRPDLYPFTKDNYGPIWVPKAGVTVDLTMANLPMYERIIKNYEGNALAVKDSAIYINNEIAKSYTFKMDYYFMMGDNRDNSADSRYWGFVPQDHIEGKASFVWLSIEPDKSIFSGIRFSRMFRGIN